MAPFPVSVKSQDTSISKRIVLELDLHRLEKFMELCGWYGKEFLASLDRAEEDIRKGRVKKITSFKQLRAKSPKQV